MRTTTFPAADRKDAAVRPMSASEVMMARAVGGVISKKHPRGTTMRLLHARSLTEHQRYIAEHEAEWLRAAVRDLAAKLPKHVVELVTSGVGA